MLIRFLIKQQLDAFFMIQMEQMGLKQANEAYFKKADGTIIVLMSLVKKALMKLKNIISLK